MSTITSNRTTPDPEPVAVAVAAEASFPPTRVASFPSGVALVGAGAIVLWGGTAIANKIAVGHMDAMTAGVLRSMIAAFIAGSIAFAGRLPRPSGARQIGLLLVSGISSFAVWPMMLSFGLGRTTAGHAALIMALLPVFTGLVGSFLERRVPKAGWWIGALIAIVGTSLLVFHRSAGAILAESGNLSGDLVILSGVVICATGYAAGGRLSPVIGTWGTTFWGLTSALVILVPAFIALAPRTDWSAVGFAGWGAIGYMAILSSIVGYAAWFWALGHGGIARIGSFQFMQPVLTLVLAAILLGEHLTMPLIGSAATILAGTALAQHDAARR